jgi:hypothetical protein
VIFDLPPKRSHPTNFAAALEIDGVPLGPYFFTGAKNGLPFSTTNTLIVVAG